MNKEPKLTAPQRRYGIVGNSNDVNQELGRAFVEQKPAFFRVELTDIAEELPIPESILSREIGMYVVGLTCRRHSGDVRAFGTTVENSAEVVTVHVPKNRENRSILYLLDIESGSKE